MSLAKRSNKYIDETMPWVLAKDEAKRGRLATVLYNLVESIRITAVMLSSVMPGTSKSIFEQISATETGWDSILEFGKTQAGAKMGEAAPLFGRIDEKKMMEEIEAELDAKEDKKAPEENLVSIDDFAKLDIRAGKVLESKAVEGSDKLLVSKIDVEEKVLQVVSGIAKSYKPEEFVGKTVAVICNLKPVKLRGVLSEGMILAASDKKGITVLEAGDAAPGTKIS